MSFPPSSVFTIGDPRPTPADGEECDINYQAEGMKYLLGNELFSDAVVMIEEQSLTATSETGIRIPVHKVVLWSASKSFAAKFTDDWNEEPIQIFGYRESVVYSFLR